MRGTSRVNWQVSGPARAKELEEEEKTGSWKEYTFSPDYITESKQGKHPSTFGSFLEGHSFDLREQGYDISRGGLEELLEVYRWFTGFGGNQQAWAYTGYALLKKLHQQYRNRPLEEGARVVSEALASKQQFGKYHLPSFVPEDKVTFAIETEDMGDGTYSLKAMIVTKGGHTYRNRWPKELLHYLCKRLRASNITRDKS